MLVNVTYTVQYMEWDGMREYDMKLWYEYIYIYIATMWKLSLIQINFTIPS